MEAKTNLRTEYQFSNADLSEALQHYVKKEIMDIHSEAIMSGSKVNFEVTVYEGDNSATLTVSSCK